MRFLMVLLGVSLLAAKPVSLPEVVAELCPPMGVAPEIALRVMRVESNCRPYAIGVQMQRVHHGYFPTDSVTAQATLKTALSYTCNVGIGPMQLNWRVWGEVLGVSRKGCSIPARLFSSVAVYWAVISGARRRLIVALAAIIPSPRSALRPTDNVF
jgi:hypothetical protein